LVHNKEAFVGSKARASIPENAGRRETIMKKTINITVVSW
jgi:hypothetical protein